MNHSTADGSALQRRLRFYGRLYGNLRALVRFREREGYEESWKLQRALEIARALHRLRQYRDRDVYYPREHAVEPVETGRNDPDCVVIGCEAAARAYRTTRGRKTYLCSHHREERPDHLDTPCRARLEDALRAVFPDGPLHPKRRRQLREAVDRQAGEHFKFEDFRPREVMAGWIRRDLESRLEMDPDTDRPGPEDFKSLEQTTRTLQAALEAELSKLVAPGGWRPPEGREEAEARIQAEATRRADGAEERVLAEVDLQKIERRAGLSSKERRAWSLQQYESLTRREIADAMGCAVGTVDSYLHRAREKIRRAADDLGLREAV